MAAIEVCIKRSILEWVYMQSVNQEADPDIIEQIKSWLAGVNKPIFSQIEKISTKLHIPLGYFFLMNPPQESLKLLEFRTVDSVMINNPSRNLIDTVHNMEEIQAWMREFREQECYERLSIVGSVNRTDNLIHIAECMRRDLDLALTWYENIHNAEESFRFIRNKLNDCNIMVMMNGVVKGNTHRKLNVKEFRAFVLIDDMAPLIFINTADTANGKLFSLIHEAVHVWLGENSLYNDNGIDSKVNELEMVCNAVTAELLVPEIMFIKEWGNLKEVTVEEKIFKLAKLFNCSEIVIARRAYENRIIKKEKFFEISNKVLSSYVINKGNGGNFYTSAASKLDRNFVSAVCASVNTGRLSYTQAYRMTNTTGKTFSEVMHRLGGVTN